MADSVFLRLSGVDELKVALRAIPDVLRKRVLRNALAAGAREIRDAARGAAPVLQKPSAFRSPGTIRKNIVVRTSKFARQAGDVGVYVGVRPLNGRRQDKLGKRGAKNPHDPYYWWWQEFGWVAGGNVSARKRRTQRMAPRRVPGKRFISGAAQTRGDVAVQRFMQSVVPQIEKLNQKGALRVG